MSLVDIAYTTELPVDKIVKVLEGSVAVSTLSPIGGFGTPYVHRIPHGFTRPVFTQLVSSSDNSTFVDGGSKDMCYSGSTDVCLLTNQPSGTIYYRIICSWIDNYTTATFDDIDLNWQKNITFDSRDNYQKIFMQDEIEMAANTSTSINHSLGTSPNAKVYFEALSGEVWPANYGGTGNAFLYDLTNQTELYFVSKLNTLDITVAGGSATRRVWYRVYQ